MSLYLFMFLLISAVFFTLSLAGLIIITVRHWLQLQALDVINLPQTRAAQTKTTLLEERLKRKIISYFLVIWKFLRPQLVKLKDMIRDWYHKLLEQERNLRGQSEREDFNQKGKHEQNSVIYAKLKEVESAETEAADLEEKYLEVLSLDPKNPEAYHGLARLYFKQKDFLHAREIYEHIIKLSGETIDKLLDMAECLIEELKLKKALNVLKKALKMEPKNPKIIDRLVELSIMMKDRVLAKSYLKQLREVNPDNQKIKEFKEKIKNL